MEKLHSCWLADVVMLYSSELSIYKGLHACCNLYPLVVLQLMVSAGCDCYL